MDRLAGDDTSDATSAFVRIALEVSEQRGWRRPTAWGGAPMWLAADDPAVLELLSG